MRGCHTYRILEYVSLPSTSGTPGNSFNLGRGRGRGMEGEGDSMIRSNQLKEDKNNESRNKEKEG
jgi:hypothetical protein